jgi:hypothetical protein
MDLTNVTFIKVDIEETKIVAFFRRSGPLYNVTLPGPLYNVTLPKSEYFFLSNKGYKMTIRQYILSDGSIVNADDGSIVNADDFDSDLSGDLDDVSSD